MRLSKKERDVVEKNWNTEYDNPNSNCSGSFYIWNRAKTEICTHRENCVFFQKWKQVFNKVGYYTLPIIRFYYAENFRKCKYKKFNN